MPHTLKKEIAKIITSSFPSAVLFGALSQQHIALRMRIAPPTNVGKKKYFHSGLSEILIAYPLCMLHRDIELALSFGLLVRRCQAN